jgi:hypothetical protein
VFQGFIEDFEEHFRSLFLGFFPKLRSFNSFIQGRVQGIELIFR